MLRQTGYSQGKRK